MDTTLLLVLVAGALAIVYGVVTALQVVGSPAGSQRMQEIAAAIQEARAPTSTAST